jgi:predicted RNase H-like HicB family nuclease
MGAVRVRVFSLSRYIEETLRRAEYHRDDDGVVIAKVPGAAGFFAQGDSFEEARDNLRDVIEGNTLLALQLGFELPLSEGMSIEERDGETHPS